MWATWVLRSPTLFDIKPKMEMPSHWLSYLLGESGAAGMVPGISAPLFIPKMHLT